MNTGLRSDGQRHFAKTGLRLVRGNILSRRALRYGARIGGILRRRLGAAGDQRDESCG
jgi:hypothetical protein